MFEHVEHTFTLTHPPITSDDVWTHNYYLNVYLNMIYLTTPHCSAASKVRCVKGEQMYKLTRDELKETFGASVGIRLFSQLQKDRDRVRLASQ